MPPVRWKLLIMGMALCLASLGPRTTAYGQQAQETISMSSDGWRPIIGTGRHSSVASVVTEASPQPPSPPSRRTASATAKAPPAQASPKSTGPGGAVNGIYKKSGAKVPFHSKPPAPATFMSAPSGPHGATHLQMRPNNQQVIRKHNQQVITKQQALNKPLGPPNQKRKPVRGQAVAYSQRDEVFLPPPNSGTYSFVKSISPVIKTRETHGVGTLLGTNHFSISQPNSHFEFTNRFALPDDSIFNRPVPTFIFPSKQQQPQQNYQFKNSPIDEFTRNLVPPPLNRFQQQPQQEKQRIKNTQKAVQENIVPVTEPLVKLDQYTTKATIRTAALENVAVQVPPPFEQSFSFTPQKPQDQNANVQVTKEKLQHFPSSLPPNFAAPSLDYVDYNYHTVPKPSNLPKTQTYEVTEGKWLDSPNPYQFSPPLIIPQKIRKLPPQGPPQGPPQFIFQQERQPLQVPQPPPQFHSGSVRPPIFQSSPLVELNVPAFLPTPYRPQNVVPTLPTQSEVSTVFSQVSQKMNKYKNEHLTTNPFYFDVKEVSTHYPILGKPEPKPQPTDTPYITQELAEISNDVTTFKDTLKEEVPTVIPSTETTTKDTTKIRRRRPRPRRPTSTTTTTTPPPPTTTEDTPPGTEAIETQHIVPEEAEPTQERPAPPTRTRQRRPIRYRQRERGGAGNNEEEPKEENTRINGDRGRQRYRNRNAYNSNYNGNNQNHNEIRTPPKRKRVRTTSTEAPTEAPADQREEEDMVSFEELTKVEFQPAESSAKVEETMMSVEDLNVRANRYETEAPVHHFETTSQIEAGADATTTAQSATEPAEVYRATSQAATTEPPVTSPAENEVDYTTHTQPPSESEENRRYTVATAPPTTTTTEATTTSATTKSHRIRGRPIKYDSSSRPKFSVKDYRQKMSQQSASAQAQSTTEGYRTSSESLRLRFPNRLRTRTSASSTTTTTSTEAPQLEESEEPHRYRSRYRYKDTRNNNAEENEEKQKVKSVNSRIRPFGRQKSSTTEAPSSTPRVSIKPYNFSARRRPFVPSLRERIHSRLRHNATETAEATTEAELTSTAGMSTGNVESSTEIQPLLQEPTTETLVITDVNRSDNVQEENDANQDGDMKDDALYSQRVSELTSSFKDQYAQPGLFSSVSATSRRIPSHFTLSTDEPMLPIEAFFPDIKGTKKQDKYGREEAKDDAEKEE